MYDGISVAPLVGEPDQEISIEVTPSRKRMSSPASGRTLGGVVTASERPVRQAISKLGRAVAVDKGIGAQLFGCTVYGPGAHLESFDLRLAWFMVTTVLVHTRRLGNTSTSTFSEALNWFLGDHRFAERIFACYPMRSVQAAEKALSELEVTEDFWDLLPYVLEPHGHITRSELEASDVAKATRSTKKNSGVYYTPSDVADFMISCASDSANSKGDWLDPACGTGVFLRAIVRHNQAKPTSHSAEALSLVKSRIFAIDKSALSTDLAAFVLFSECWDSLSASCSPFFDWQQIKKNIVCMDSLRIVPASCTVDMHVDKSECISISDIFPSVIDGVFDQLVMNPPYAKVQVDQHIKANWQSYAGISLGGMADTHLGFTEMMWKLVRPESKSVAVLPLSIGTNTTKSYKALREVLLNCTGRKEFLFFDREPQALFGEDIKTRNVVIVRHSGAKVQNSVQTSRMLKWTAPQRANIFTRNRVVPIDKSACHSFIPKIGSMREANIYAALQSNQIKLAAARCKPTSERLLLDDALLSCVNQKTVLISATAYNFINCFYGEGLPAAATREYSSSPLNALVFSQSLDASAAFAVLSSRMCFWLWHVEGDGFHLTSDFLQRLPIWAALHDDQIRSQFSDLGRQLWTQAKKNVVGSVNGGKQTYSFHAGHSHALTIEIDRLLVNSLGLMSEDGEALEEFIHSTVSIDGKRRTRGTNSVTSEQA